MGAQQPVHVIQFVFTSSMNWSYFITTRQWKNIDQFLFKLTGLVFGYFTFWTKRQYISKSCSQEIAFKNAELVFFFRFFYYENYIFYIKNCVLLTNR